MHSTAISSGQRTAAWATILVVTTVAMIVGLPIRGGLRHWVFEQTRPLRFREDVQRGFYWGRQALEQGYLNVYEPMKNQPPQADLWLDYAPLRLAVMTFWAKVNDRRMPGVSEYQNTFEFAKPVLWINTVVELCGAVGMFLLVRHWVIRRHLEPGQPVSASDRLSGVWPGLVAAMLLWFNPAMLLSGYGWPTWDVWVIAFFVWAVYLACIDWWFLSGLVIALGAMFKGQLLAVACVFLIWPLVSGSPRMILRLLLICLAAIALRLWLIEPAGAAARVLGAIAGLVAILCAAGIVVLGAVGAQWSAVLRWAGGFVFGVGAVTSGWMLRHAASGRLNPGAVTWVMAVTLAIPGAAVGAAIMRKLSSRTIAPWIIAAAMFAMILACSLGTSYRFHWQSLALAAGAATCIILLPPRNLGYIWAGAVGVALLLCIPMFHASTAWYECGWRFGPQHFDRLIVGRPNNLPALLVERYNFDNNGDANYPLFTIPAGVQFGWPAAHYRVTLKLLMGGLFVALMLPCAVTAAAHAQRNDKRFLVAITTPWLLFFCLPLQIHERYLLYGAAVAACMIAVGLGMTLLHILLSFASFTMILNILENPGRRLAFEWENPQSVFVRYGEWFREVCSAMHPDFAWAILLCTAVFFYVAIMPPWQQEGGAKPNLDANSLMVR